MAIKVSGVLIFISLIFSVKNGMLQELSEAAIEGSSKAVTLVISLIGVMCLWSGLMKAAERAGVLKGISKLIKPLLRLIFPESAKSGKGIEQISAAIVANVLGIGNAATPLAVNAVKELTDGSDTATDDLVTFTVLGTAFPSIIPTTVITLRASAGSENPFDILPAVWVCSLILSVFAVVISRIMCKHKNGVSVSPPKFARRQKA